MNAKPRIPERELADYCLWWPLRSAPCYAPASFVVVRPAGQMVAFTCAAHRDAWAGSVQGPSTVLERADWEAAGAGYRGPALGG